MYGGNCVLLLRVRTRSGMIFRLEWILPLLAGSKRGTSVLLRVLLVSLGRSVYPSGRRVPRNLYFWRSPCNVSAFWLLLLGVVLIPGSTQRLSRGLSGNPRIEGLFKPPVDLLYLPAGHVLQRLLFRISRILLVSCSLVAVFERCYESGQRYFDWGPCLRLSSLLGTANRNIRVLVGQAVAWSIFNWIGRGIGDF
jgi:hypothetical protein